MDPTWTGYLFTILPCHLLSAQYNMLDRGISQMLHSSRRPTIFLLQSGVTKSISYKYSLLVFLFALDITNVCTTVGVEWLDHLSTIVAIETFFFK